MKYLCVKVYADELIVQQSGCKGQLHIKNWLVFVYPKYGGKNPVVILRNVSQNTSLCIMRGIRTSWLKLLLKKDCGGFNKCL